MILVDTNVISELMRPTPSSAVISWIDEQETINLFISTITIAEITYGIRVMPKGKKREKIQTAFSRAIDEVFAYRIISFDNEAAYAYGEIMGRRKELGHPMSVIDGQIAAIAATHHFSIATRNIKDFQACNLRLINPWEQNS